MAHLSLFPAQLLIQQKLHLRKLILTQIRINSVQHHPEQNKQKSGIERRTKVSPVTQLHKRISLLLPVLRQQRTCIRFLLLPAICFQKPEEIFSTDSLEQLGEERTVLQKTSIF